MNALRNEIVQHLRIVPNDKLQEVLNFLKDLVFESGNSRTQEDTDWLESDLSNLGSYEPYEWQEGKLEEGRPVKYIAETGKIEIDI